jgi:hypothetical protein
MDAVVPQDGRVMLGDNLLRVDSFNCVGVHRDDIKRRVIGPSNTQVTLEFGRPGQDVFQVWCRHAADVILCLPGEVDIAAWSCGCPASAGVVGVMGAGVLVSWVTCVHLRLVT